MSVGGDCDLIYGRFSDFLNFGEGYEVIGGYHGHLTAFRNTSSFRKLFRHVVGLVDLLLDDRSHATDEIAFRGPLLRFIENNRFSVFDMHAYFCDVVPTVYFANFRPDHEQRPHNFFEVYRPEADINYVEINELGQLTVFYLNGESRPCIYCHLQKRPMSIAVSSLPGPYYIVESSFVSERPGDSAI